MRAPVMSKAMPGMTAQSIVSGDMRVHVRHGVRECRTGRAQDHSMTEFDTVASFAAFLSTRGRMTLAGLFSCRL